MEVEELAHTCVICMADTKAWCFKHGSTVHLCACESCAKMCFKEKRVCPVCNQVADEILEVFSA